MKEWIKDYFRPHINYREWIREERERARQTTNAERLASIDDHEFRVRYRNARLAGWVALAATILAAVNVVLAASLLELASWLVFGALGTILFITYSRLLWVNRTIYAAGDEMSCQTHWRAWVDELVLAPVEILPLDLPERGRRRSVVARESRGIRNTSNS